MNIKGISQMFYWIYDDGSCGRVELLLVNPQKGEREGMDQGAFYFKIEMLQFEEILGLVIFYVESIILKMHYTYTYVTNSIVKTMCIQ